jgi:hypothetical protein
MTLTYQPYLGKTVIFCLPGSHYSGRFLVSFTQLLEDCRKAGMQTVISQDYSSMVNFARCKVAGADVSRGPLQSPFGGKIPYDYMMWIDSDIRFTSKDFFKLVDMRKDIASGWYTQPGGSTPVVEKMEEDYFQTHGYFEFIHKDKMAKREKIFQADYIGFGWVLVKKGVFESLPYPWFAPKRMSIGPMEDMCSEDVAFCIDARELGYSIWVDPTIKVGHEKIQVL